MILRNTIINLPNLVEKYLISSGPCITQDVILIKKNPNEPKKKNAKNSKMSAKHHRNIIKKKSVYHVISSHNGIFFIQLGFFFLFHAK